MRLTPRDAKVHPRWTWAALLVALAGLVVGGVGIMILSWEIAIGGAVLVVLGLIVGVRAGWTHDVHATRAMQSEIADVVAGRVHEGATSDQDMGGPRAQERAQHADQRRRAALAGARVGWVPLADLGAALLLLVAVSILVAQWTLYRHTQAAQHTALHALGVAVLVGFVGLRVVTDRARPHPIASCIGVVSGIGLVLLSLLVSTASRVAVTFGVGCGVLIVVGSLCLLSWREPATPAGHAPR